VDRWSEPDAHHRRSIRLPGYDYAQPGAYFVTIVSHGRELLFGAIVDGEMQPNACGEAVQRVWFELPEHYPQFRRDAFVVMPNHVHGIVVIEDEPSSSRRAGLAEVVRGFKTFSARRVNGLRGTAGVSIWQRNHYERVIRDDRELDRVRADIGANPSGWTEDRENPAKLL